MHRLQWNKGQRNRMNINVSDSRADGKYRNIKFSPSLKSTDQEDTYIIEIRCWLRPKDD